MWWKILIGIIAILMAAVASLISQLDIKWNAIANVRFGSGIETPSEQVVEQRPQT